MPRYEFLCEKCQKPFELTMTIAEHEKGRSVPDMQEHERRAAARRFHGADGEEELRVRGTTDVMSIAFEWDGLAVLNTLQ